MRWVNHLILFAGGQKRAHARTQNSTGGDEGKRHIIGKLEHELLRLPSAGHGTFREWDERATIIDGSRKKTARHARSQLTNATLMYGRSSQRTRAVYIGERTRITSDIGRRFTPHDFELVRLHSRLDNAHRVRATGVPPRAEFLDSGAT